eukprot:6785802-Pyramimonas_sp.AAC.1
MILRELGLDRPGPKGLESPAAKLSFHEATAREALPTLDAAGIRSHRSLVMRAAYLSLHRPDIAEATKTLCKGDLKRLGRYLVSHRCLVSRCESQRLPTEVTVIVGSDHAGCPITRKSTSGIVCKFGRHVLKASGSLQSTLSLSSGESESNAIVKGAAAGLLAQSIAQDLGVSLG